MGGVGWGGEAEAVGGCHTARARGVVRRLREGSTTAVVLARLLVRSAGGAGGGSDGGSGSSGGQRARARRQGQRRRGQRRQRRQPARRGGGKMAEGGDTQTTATHELQAEEELRVEVDWGATVFLTLVKGSAEVRGRARRWHVQRTAHGT